MITVENMQKQSNKYQKNYKNGHAGKGVSVMSTFTESAFQ